MEVLYFELGARRHALRCSEVREILRAAAIHPLPQAPGIVEGVFNLRGQILPVLDLRARLHQPAKPLEVSDHFIVAWANGRDVALRVDRVLELGDIQAADIEDPGSLVPGLRFVAGIARLPDGLLFIHDLSAFLSQAEAEALDASLAAFPEPQEDTSP